MKRMYRVALLIFILCLVVPSIALAIPVKVTGMKPGQWVQVNHYPGYYVAAGVYNLKVGQEKSRVDSFCIDFFQRAPTQWAKNYEYKELDALFSASVVTDLNKLWGTYYNEKMNNYDAAGLQLAIWEVTTDTGRDINDGFFSTKYKSDGARAQVMLDSLANITISPSDLSLMALAHDSKQDYLVSTPVPEPATMLLVGTGMLGAALIRKRKNR